MPYNEIFDLTTQQIKNTFQQVTQYDTASATFYTGQGQPLITTASYARQSLSASFAISTRVVTASFAITASFALNTVSPNFASSSGVIIGDYSAASPPAITSSISNSILIDIPSGGLWACTNGYNWIALIAP